jgi:DNA-directed RNA polymerase subunit N (RpoN/RPB10)
MKGYERVERQVRRFRGRLEEQAMPPARLEEAVERYQCRRMDMTRLELTAKAAADHLGRMPLTQRGRLILYVRALYGVSRKFSLVEWPHRMCAVAAGRIQGGLEPVTVVAVLEALWRELSGQAPPEGLAERVQEFAAKLPISEPEVVVSVVSPKKERPKKVKRVVSDRDVAELGQQTPLELYTRKRALESLRFALAMHQPVVKRCVVLRLIKQYSFKALAKELELSLADVSDILSRMRVWVLRYTNYFENEWYWTEGGKKYQIPEPGPVQPAA